MFRLLSGTDLNKYKPRYYTIASTDTMSAEKMKEFEANVSYNIDFVHFTCMYMYYLDFKRYECIIY